MTYHVIPAYGRDYKSLAGVQRDWDAEKDFIIADISSSYDGKPINKQQTKPGDRIVVRYEKLRKQAVLAYKKKERQQ
jgi:hypothetical protein